LKIVVLGHGGVGKTSLIDRYIRDQFSETLSTIGASFALKKWQDYYFGIWDTAGQDKYTKISSYYSKGAQAAIIAYDITDRKTFDSIEKYINFLRNAEENCYLVLVGTKFDLLRVSPSKRQVFVEDVLALTEKYRASHYETSSKENYNISEVFDSIGYHCLSSRTTRHITSSSKHEIRQYEEPANSSSIICGCCVQ
jgi:small GTP-binding protein